MPEAAIKQEGAHRPPTPHEILAEWRLKIAESRESQKQCLAHGWPDRAKWYEGKADALDRCADQLEYHILPTMFNLCQPR